MKSCFVMFLFNAAVNLEGKLEEDGKTLRFRDEAGESAALEFKRLEQIDTSQISTVQRPVFEDLLLKKSILLRK